jgi:hypothetical protein
MLQSSTLRPGLLVSLKTSVTGNVSYYKRTIESEHLESDGSTRMTWETERKIADVIEHEAAQKARYEAGHAIRRVCTQSTFGLLCPEDQADKLEAAIADARKIATAFNATARVTQLGVYVMTGRVAQDDVEAIRAINSEVRDLLTEMERGLQNLDVAAVRAAASKARNIGQMLSPSASEKIKVAVDAARASARDIVKAGEAAAVEIDTVTIRKIAEQRTMFLDIDETGQEITTPVVAGRAIDLAPVE